MTDAFSGYGLSLVAVISILAQIIYTLVKKRQENGHSNEFRTELRNDVKDVKRSVHTIEGTLQALVTKMALVEYRVTRLEDKRGHEA